VKKENSDFMRKAAEVVDRAKGIIASSSIRLEYDRAELYLVDRATMERLRAFRDSIVTLADSYGEGIDSKKVARSFAGELKLINPDTPAIKYNLYLRKTPKIISDREKVMEAIEREFAIWANVVRKGAKKEIEEHEEYTENDARDLLETAERTIEEEKAKLDALLEDPEGYDIRITNYERAEAYPTISYATPEGKRVDHLSIRIPNVLWYEEEPGAERRRSDASIQRIVESYDRIGGTIYFAPMEEER
jgi:hypothetical protein